MIVFNGKTYNHPDEMPANERGAYDQIARMLIDKNGNGIPDFMEGDMAQNVTNAFTSNTIRMNGRVYDGLDELPEDARARVKNAFEKLSEMGIVTKEKPTVSVQTIEVGGKSNMPVSKPFLSREYNPAIQEEENAVSPLLWVALGVGLTLCLLIAGVGAFFLLQ